MKRSPAVNSKPLAPIYWVPAALFIGAVVLASNPVPFRSPVSEPANVPAEATDTTPVRQPKLQPSYYVAVYTYRCSDCHAIITECNCHSVGQVGCWIRYSCV